MSNKIIVGEKVKSIREQKQLTIEALAERSGVSEEVINFIENEKRYSRISPTHQDIERIGSTIRHLP